MDIHELFEDQSAGKATSEPLFTKGFLFICLSGLSFVLSNNMVNPAIPLYLVQMGASQAEVGVVMAMRSLIALLSRPLAGLLLDRGLLSPLLGFGGLNSIVTAVAYIFAPVVWIVGGVEAVKGLGITAMTTAGNTAVSDLAPVRRRGEAIGIYSIISPISVAIGPAIGMVLLAQAGFTSLFGLSALLGMISLILAIPIKPLEVDRSAVPSFGLISRSALLPSAAMTTISFAVSPLYAFIPLYATQNQLGDPGLFFTVYAVSMFLIRFESGGLSDNYGRIMVFIPATLAMALSSLYLSTGPGYLGFLAAGALLGGGLGAAHPAMIALAVDRAPLGERGIAMSTIWGALDVGLVLGTLANGFILEWGGFGAMFLANGVVPVLGVIGFLVLDRQRRRRQAFTGT